MLFLQTSGWAIGIRIPRSVVLATVVAFPYLRGQASRRKITEGGK